MSNCQSPPNEFEYVTTSPESSVSSEPSVPDVAKLPVEGEPLELGDAGELPKLDAPPPELDCETPTPTPTPTATATTTNTPTPIQMRRRLLGLVTVIVLA